MTEDYRVYYSGKYFGLHGYSENDAFLGKPNINDYNLTYETVDEYIKKEYDLSLKAQKREDYSDFIRILGAFLGFGSITSLTIGFIMVFSEGCFYLLSNILIGAIGASLYFIPEYVLTKWSELEYKKIKNDTIERFLNDFLLWKNKKNDAIAEAHNRGYVYRMNDTDYYTKLLEIMNEIDAKDDSMAEDSYDN